MGLEAMYVVGASLLSLALFWIFVLVIRPNIARARLLTDATAVRYRIVNAILDGDIEPDDPAAIEALRFCHLLTHHQDEVGLTEGFAISIALHRMGVDEEYARPPEVTFAQMTPRGRNLMITANKELTDLLARYLVCGSLLWWMLRPAQALWRLIDRFVDQNPVTSPAQMAAEVRSAAREPVTAESSWLTLGDGVPLGMREHRSYS